MQAAYPATYCDTHGEIATAIEHDGRALRMSLHGVVFEGCDFDMFEPVPGGDPASLSRFQLASGSLCACTLDFSMPVSVITGAGTARATLAVHLELGRARANGSLDELILRLAFVLDDVRIESAGRWGWFEDELGDIQRQLPGGWHLRMCWGCAWSDYSPAGHGLWGGLACFRDNKTGYRAVQSKVDLFEVWDTMTELVPETHLCPEFEQRTPHTGYRG
jgi:hypothetical protein